MTSFVQTLVQWDHALFLVINATLSHPILDVFFVNITEPRFWIIPGIAALFFFFKKHRTKALIIAGLMMVTVAISDPVSSRVLKHLFHRLRPCHPDALIAGGHFLGGLKTSLSFPSSHAANIFAQATLLTLFFPKRWWWFFTFAFFIGYSRVYVGVHYPLDVAGGAVFGMLVGGMVFGGYWFIHNKIKPQKPKLTQF